MGIFRSEDINLIKIVMRKDTAYDMMEALGEFSIADFIDLNKDEQSFDLPFTKQIKRCNDVIRKIEYLQEICESHGIKQNQITSLSEFRDAKKALQMEFRTSKYGIFDIVEKKCEEKDSFISEQIRSIKDMHHNLNYLVEYREVLSKVAEYYNENEQPHIQLSRHSNVFNRQEERKSNRGSFVEEFKGRASDSSEEDKQIGGNYHNKSLNISTIAGTINVNEVERMKRIVFRVSRGNALLNTIFIDRGFIEYSEKKIIHKHVYIITFQEGEYLRNALGRVCESFDTDRFSIPTANFQSKIEDVKNKIKEASQLISTTANQMKHYLEKVCTLGNFHLGGLGVSRLSLYKMIAEYDRAIFSNLNKFCTAKALIQGFFWSTISANDIFKRLDFDGSIISEFQLEDCYNHNINPPTHFRSNRFLEPFQLIVSTYGVPSYKEINPTVFTIITFPLLFGMMFGDIGHGICLFLFSCFLCCCPARFRHSSLQPIAEIRYLLLMCGFFSTFCGFIYNDFMSIPLEIFNSCYDADSNNDVSIKEDCVYSFGVDSIWYSAKNELVYLNSLKMKLSVIFGVSQMSLGVVLKALNSRYFKKKLDLYFEFIPQLALLLSIFGYMVMLILIKWCTFYSDTSGAPSIVTYMIDMFLNLGTIKGNAIVHSHGLNEILHIFILLIAILCIPCMLIIKPYIIFKNKGRERDSEFLEMQDFDHRLEAQSKQKYRKFHEEDDFKVHQNKEECKYEEVLRL